MKKHIFLLMMLCILVLFVTGCNNNNAELPTFEELTKINSSMLTYIKNLSSLYANDSTWSKCYSNSIQTKGDLQVLAIKIATVEADKFDSEKGFGKFYF